MPGQGWGLWWSFRGTEFSHGSLELWGLQKEAREYRGIREGSVAALVCNVRLRGPTHLVSPHPPHFLSHLLRLQVPHTPHPGTSVGEGWGLGRHCNPARAGSCGGKASQASLS